MNNNFINNLPKAKPSQINILQKTLKLLKM